MVVAGFLRTGTSAMMQCLKASGFYIGKVGELAGGYKRCEHMAFRKLNRRILNDPKSVADDMMDFADNLDVDAIKTLGLVIPVWLKIPKFRDAKYIWMKRNQKDMLASFMALKKVSIVKAKEAYERYLKYLKAIRNTNHIVVYYEDLMLKSQETAQKLGDFLGRPIDFSPLDKGKWHYDIKKSRSKNRKH